MHRIEIGASARLDTLRLIDVAPPRPAKGEILVRVRASSLNFHDYLVATGILPVATGRVPMSDGVGEVVEIGEDANIFKPGDRVLGTFFPNWLDGLPNQHNTARMRGDHVDGFASEYVALAESNFALAPKHLSDVEAATLPCAGLTAWRALVVEGEIKPGDSVLVEGSGGVSIFALQIAKMAGATVIATTSTPEKAERLRALGADHVIDYSVDTDWGRTARDISNGGVDHVVEVAGGDLTQAMTACRVGGGVYIIGALSRKPIQFPPMLAIGGNTRIKGVTVGSKRHLEDFIRAVEAGRLRPALDQAFPLSEISTAFRRQESRAHFGKICLTL